MTTVQDDFKEEGRSKAVSDTAGKVFEAALQEAAEYGAEMNNGTGDAASRPTSLRQVLIRKLAKSEFFWPVWWKDLEVLEGKDDNGGDTYALVNPRSPDIEYIRGNLAAHFKKFRFTYCVTTAGARILVPVAKHDNGYFRACREFTETTIKARSGPFKRIADMSAGQHVYLEALEPKAFAAGPEHQDQVAILQAAFPVVNSKDDPLVRRLLGLEF